MIDQQWNVPQSQWDDRQIKQAQAEQYAHLMQMKQAAQMPYPSEQARDGVLSMTESAHSAFERLKQAFGELHSMLGPLTEPYPFPATGGFPTANQISEAPAVAGLRSLIERIDEKTSEIHALIGALRV